MRGARKKERKKELRKKTRERERERERDKLGRWKILTNKGTDWMSQCNFQPPPTHSTLLSFRVSRTFMLFFCFLSTAEWLTTIQKASPFPFICSNFQVLARVVATIEWFDRFLYFSPPTPKKFHLFSLTRVAGLDELRWNYMCLSCFVKRRRERQREIGIDWDNVHLKP